MVFGSPAQRTVALVAISLASHGALIALAPRGVPPERREPVTFDVMFEAAEAPAPALPEPALPEPPAAPTAEPPSPADTVAVAPPSAPTSPSTPPSNAAAQATTAPPSTDVVVPEAAPAGANDIAVVAPSRAQTATFSPLSVASAYFNSQPIDTPPSRSRGTTTTGPGSDRPGIDDRAASAALGEYLGRAANANPALSRREPPRFVRQLDGSQLYRGPRFAALVLPDGRVQFNDNPNFNFALRGAERGADTAQVATFDITEAIMRSRGQDPLSAERRWFLEQTEEMRDRLAAEAQRDGATREARRMNGRLRRLWNDPNKTPAERRRAIFELWESCDPTGAEGRAAREAIETFVRNELPASESNAYTRQEIEAMNAHRPANDRFNPYL